MVVNEGGSTLNQLKIAKSRAGFFFQSSIDSIKSSNLAEFHHLVRNFHKDDILGSCEQTVQDVIVVLASKKGSV